MPTLRPAYALCMKRDGAPDSIRGEYQKQGPREYYRQFGADYRNPHEHSVRRAIKAAVDAWKPDLSNVLDLAAGAKIWEFNAGAPLSASPAIAGGRIVIGSQDGKVYCFG